MIRAPTFWDRPGLLPSLLRPASRLVAAATARRVARPGWAAQVPVLCCGGATVGGAGKTTVALDLAQRLRDRGVAAHCLTRGYGGKVRGVLRVDPAQHSARLVGDEALLLSAAAPTWVARDRAAGARAAVAAGAETIVMDDGLQNPGLAKTLSLLIVDGGSGFGNGQVLPAGPLREPVAAAAARCRAAVLIGPDLAGAESHLPPKLDVLRATLEPDPAPDPAQNPAREPELRGRRVLAISAIARPEKFHATLRETGAEIVAQDSFPDHHPFSLAELDHLLDRAAALDAQPVLTAKDAVRLPAALRPRFHVLRIRLRWSDPAALEALLREAVP